MGADISKIQCDLIGISCMDDSGARDQIRREWDSRFQEHHAFWVDASHKLQLNELIKKIFNSMSSHGIMTLAGKTVILAAFLDLTKSPDPELLKEIVQIPNMLNSSLGCNVPVMLTFGNLKELTFADKEQLRQHVTQVVRVHEDTVTTRKQLVMIAKSPLVDEKDDKSWKAVVTLLDVLRRVSAPADLIPVAGAGMANDDVGFLRYGEYVGEEVERLKTRAKELQDQLSSGGATALHGALQQELSIISTQIKTNWDIDAKSQPHHPDMVVEGWMDKKRAKKGKNKKFEAARHATVVALEATGRHMNETIQNTFFPMAEQAAAYLDGYIETAKVGLALEADRVQMRNLLDVALNPCSIPQCPTLAYSDAGYDNEIFTYLQNMREYASYEAQRKFSQAVLKAYNDRSDSYFEKKRKQIQKQLDQIHLDLKQFIEREDIINLSASGHPLPQASFFPVQGGGNQCRFVLCREKQDDADITAACSATATKVYYIDKTTGGINKLDNASIKSIQLLMFDCEEHLKDLIK